MTEAPHPVPTHSAKAKTLNDPTDAGGGASALQGPQDSEGILL